MIVLLKLVILLETLRYYFRYVQTDWWLDGSTVNHVNHERKVEIFSIFICWIGSLFLFVVLIYSDKRPPTGRPGIGWQATTGPPVPRGAIPPHSPAQVVFSSVSAVPRRMQGVVLAWFHPFRTTATPLAAGATYRI